jgi:PAS domain S-box-containing protein
LAERARRYRATLELQRRNATIDELTVDVTSLRSVLQEYIQQREAAEEVLRRGEERYRVLVDNLTTIVFQVDRGLRWTFLNPAWETVTGRSPEESIGQVATLVMVGDDAGELEALFQRLLQGQESRGEQVIRVRCVRGQRSLARAAGDPDARFVRRDRGRQRHAERCHIAGVVEIELRRQQTLYRLIAENSSDIIALVALHGGRFTYVSPSIEHVLGYTPDEILGVEWWTLLDPKDSDRITQSVQSIREREPVTETARVRRKDGTWTWIEARADAVLEDDGQVVGYRITARDATEHRAAGLALMESEAKYRLLAESIDDIVCLQDLDGTALYYSASTRRR